MNFDEEIQIEGLSNYALPVKEYGEDSPPPHCVVRFEVKPVRQTFESTVQNRDVYKSVVYIEKQIDMNTSALSRPITDSVELIEGKWVVKSLGIPHSDIDLYRAEWNSFAKGTTMAAEGTPVDILFRADPARAELFKSRNVYTLERLENLTDTDCQLIGLGASDDRERARRYMTKARAQKPFTDLQVKIEEKDRRLAQVEHQLNLYMKKLAEVTGDISLLDKTEEGIEGIVEMPIPPKKKGKSKGVQPEANQSI